MANNKNNKPKSAPIESNDEKKRLDRTRIFLIIFAAVALVALVASLVIGIVLSRNDTVDYMKLKLSRYVDVPESVYKGYKVSVSIPEVTDEDVAAEILSIRCANKTAHSGGPVYNETGVTVSLGDVVNLYYRGYTLEGGVKKYFDGGCNFGDAITELEIGTGDFTAGTDSGTFIKGFDTELIGKNQTGYATVSTVTDGLTKPGDMIKLTYSVSYADGKSAYSKTVLINLSDTTLDERWGEGFSAYFNNPDGIKIGEQFATKKEDDAPLYVSTIKETEDGKGQDCYFDMSISAVYRVSDEEKMEINVKFPDDYQAEELKGKDATFEIYITTVKDYDVPELDDKFITETLKLTEEELSSYSGGGLVEKYTSYVEAQLNEIRNDSVTKVIADAFWEQAVKGSTFKKLPKKDVKAMYNSYLASLQSEFTNQAESYQNNFDAFARVQLGLDAMGDWEAELMKFSEESIKQKLVFYFVVRKENLIPTDEEYRKLHDEIFADYLQNALDASNITEDSEGYDEIVERYSKMVMATYGEEYFDELVRQEFAMEKIAGFADVTYK